ncbi:MAG: hypothetical protein M3Z25_04860 [Actinomycetota bacterium]|nr:hypothetical protein [Actinomycetota bacterium]
MHTHATNSVAVAELRRRITELSVRLRGVASTDRVPEPRFVEFDTIRLPDGRVVGRKKVILMSGGCSVPTCTMCPFTNENNYGRVWVPDDLLSQVRRVVARDGRDPGYEVLSLYNDGSFFAPREVPRDVQLEIARVVAGSGTRRLVVESLPQFISERVLAPFVRELGDVALEIGIGLQSADDLVREVLVNTRISRTSFERALKVMSGLGVRPKVYLMVKPPFLTDAEALADVRASVDYLSGHGVSGITLCPTRVARNTVAWELWKAGMYAPPNLWTVVEAARDAHERMAVRVACVNLRGTDFESIFPGSCVLCADRVIDALVLFGETGDPDDLPEPCTCRPRLAAAELDGDAILERARCAVDVLTATGATG